MPGFVKVAMEGPWKVVDDSWGYEVLASYPTLGHAQGYADAANRYSSRCVRVFGPGCGCQCGPKRTELITAGDELFLPRIGCTRCGEWDSPPKLRS